MATPEKQPGLSFSFMSLRSKPLESSRLEIFMRLRLADSPRKSGSYRILIGMRETEISS